MSAQVDVLSSSPQEASPRPSLQEQQPPQEEGFEELEDSVKQHLGHLSGNYPCEWEGTQGTLFAGTHAVAFVGFTFFFQKRVEIEWMNVLQVVKTERITNNNGGTLISFIMRHEDKQYDFEHVPHAERVWATLVSLHSEALRNQPHSTPLLTPLRATLRRMSTDPTAMMTSEKTQLHDGPTGTEAAYIAAATMASMDDLRTSSMTTNAAADSVARRQSLMMTPTHHVVGEAEVDIAVDLEQAWKELQQGGGDENSYATIAIQDLVLPCTLDDFFDKFIGNAAEFSYKTFMEASGEENVVVSPWKVEEQDATNDNNDCDTNNDTDDDNNDCDTNNNINNDDTVFHRTMEYSHPVNAPLAPPMARARKEQRYRRYGTHGISMETDTYVEDVPMADCFYVTERTLVEPSSSGVVVLSEFDIRFVKRTMFRSMIANTTRSEVLKGLQGLEVYWTEAIVSPTTTTEAMLRRSTLSSAAALRRSTLSSTRRRSTMIPTSIETVLVEEPPTQKIPFVVTSMHALILVLVLLLLTQWWMLVELKSVKYAMAEVQATVDGTCTT